MCHGEIEPGTEVTKENAREVEIGLGAEAMPALLVEPQEVKGCVLLVADIFGRSPFYENLAHRLAGLGFRALLPEYFFRLGALPERSIELAQARRARLDENQTLDDLSSAVDWFKREGSCTRVGTIGFCMGGTQVLDLAARRKDVVTVCYYGFPGRLPTAGPMTAPVPLEIVDDIAGPILGFWGDQDAGVGMENVEALARAMAERGVAFDHRIYPGLGHGFMAASGLTPEKPTYRYVSDAWSRTTEFLAAELAT